MEKDKALKADLSSRAQTWLARLPQDIAKAKKILQDVQSSNVPEDQKIEYVEKFEKHKTSLCNFRDAIEDSAAKSQHDSAKLTSADACLVKFRSDKKEWESVEKKMLRVEPSSVELRAIGDMSLAALEKYNARTSK